MQTIVGLMTLWERCERAIIPGLMTGDSTYFGLKKSTKAFAMSDDIQNYFWRVMLSGDKRENQRCNLEP